VDRLLDVYLAQTPLAEGTRDRWSTLALCLRDARRAGGRHVDTGDVLNPDLVTSWPGAMTYLSVLDQMGRAVRRTRLSPAQTRRSQFGSRQEKPFRAALVQFTGLGDRKISALYALRCSYSHFFGLVNENNDQRLRHRFVLRADHGELVRFPRRPWDGTYPAHGGRRTKAGPVGTWIDLWTLSDTIEDAVAYLHARHAGGEIKRGQVGQTAPSDAEFRDRFTVSIWE
jgi:hypothetical protein